MTHLNLGTLPNGRPFTLPMDATLSTYAFMGITGSGKTSSATVFAEELCHAKLPWIAIDPVSVWWGMRANPDGTPGGFPVVVFGGEHGDLPLERTSGAKIADVLMGEPICAVIDLASESKKFWHTWVTEFCTRLMDLNPEVPRHIFLEEAPDFLPQKASFELTARCKEAVERVVRQGRNRGYGFTIITQRPARVDKDALSQCLNLLVMRTSGPHDRRALKEWISGKGVNEQENTAVAQALDGLPSLPSGHGFFWAPLAGRFDRVSIRPRATFHPGATRQIGKVRASATLSDVRGFVERLKGDLSRVSASVPPTERGRKVSREPVGRELLERPVAPPPPDAPPSETALLREQLDAANRRAQTAELRLAKVRVALEPQYAALKGLFETLGDGRVAGAVVDRGVYEPWLAKAGKTGCRRLLEILIERGELTRNQLATLGGVGPRTSTYRAYLAWLRRNGLVDTEGETIRLRPV
jgi:hypothetical protein